MRHGARSGGNVFRQMLLAGLACLSLTPALAAGPSPTDLDWLRRECGDGALVCQSKGRIYLTELSTGRTVTVGTGSHPEFSPDGSKLAWVDGDIARGRMRRGDDTVHVIAKGIDRSGGVHWCGNGHVLVVKKGCWRKASLTGSEVEIPELTALGKGGSECDVKRCADGVWSYVSGREWRTSDGRRGRTGGKCSSSLSPDGRSVTGLHGGHKSCDLTSIRSGGFSGELRWVYASKGSKGFDNHRWSSNDERFVVCQDEKHDHLVVMKVGGTYCTRMGPEGGGEMYGDFTVGRGDGGAWPLGVAASAHDALPAWPPDRSGLAFVWENSSKSNTISPGDPRDARVCAVRPRGIAMPGRFHDMVLEGGTFVADVESNRELSAQCTASGEVSIELTVTPASLRHRGSGPVVSIASTDGRAGLALHQEDARVTAAVYSTRAGEDDGRIELFALREARPHHVLISYAPARRDASLVCYLDGRRVLSTDETRGDIAPRGGSRLSFGGDRGGRARWMGRLEGVAVYDRFIAEGRARRHYESYSRRLTARAPAHPLVVRATRRATSQLPEPGPYPQALVVCRYAVDTVESGTLDAESVLVAHWGVLNGRPQENVAAHANGSSHRLVLEPFDDHPELNELKLVDDIGDFDSPLYYDVGQHLQR